jgi:hypothetical protein
MLADSPRSSGLADPVFSRVTVAAGWLLEFIGNRQNQRTAGDHAPSAGLVIRQSVAPQRAQGYRTTARRACRSSARNRRAKGPTNCYQLDRM